MRLKIAFAGTPEFARTALQGLADSAHEVVLVLTQPDRPAGRGMRVTASPVKQLAEQRGWEVVQPRSLRLDGKYPDDALAARQRLQAAQPDVMIVAAYGLILPQWVLSLPRLGCLNIHASLLPRWRGAAPIQRAIEAGDRESGVTIMQMDAGLDTGDMLLREAVPISASDTFGTLHDRLAAVGARLLLRALEQAAKGQLKPEPQPTHGASYANKIDRHEAEIDWSAPAELLERRIRAFNPAPGATTHLGADVVKLWRAEAAPATLPAHAVPGAVLAAPPGALWVVAGRGAIAITELQRAGGKRMAVADFLRGSPVKPGTLFGRADL